jgi:hypothetical protein
VHVLPRILPSFFTHFHYLKYSHPELQGADLYARRCGRVSRQPLSYVRAEQTAG